MASKVNPRNPKFKGRLPAAYVDHPGLLNNTWAGSDMKPDTIAPVSKGRQYMDLEQTGRKNMGAPKLSWAPQAVTRKMDPDEVPGGYTHGHGNPQPGESGGDRRGGSPTGLPMADLGADTDGIRCRAGYENGGRIATKRVNV